MPDTLFGVEVPDQVGIEQTPENVFPIDPDFGFTKRRQWDTKIHSLGPHLEQRFVLRATPQIVFNVGFQAMKGAFNDENATFRQLWLFYINCRGRGTPFWFYDPIPWKLYPAPSASTGHVPYRDSPVLRITHPGSLSGAESGYDKYVGRYLCLFEEDQLSVEVFEWRLRKATLSVRGFPA